MHGSLLVSDDQCLDFSLTVGMLSTSLWPKSPDSKLMETLTCIAESCLFDVHS